MTQHQKKLAQVCQLLALARSTTFEKERESAQQMAKKIMDRFGISGPEVVAFRASLEPKRPRPARPRPRTTVIYAQPGMVINIRFGHVASWSFSSNATTNTY